MRALAQLSPSFLLQRYDGILTLPSSGSHYPRRPIMKFSLKQLFETIPSIRWSGDPQRPIEALMADSRRVVPGTLFFALPGLRTQGSFYIEEAIDRGAVAVVSMEPPGPQKHVTFIQVEDPRAVMALVAKRFFGMPDEQLRVVGITGTNGKTTVSWLVQALLRSTGNPVGLLGTIHYDVGSRTLPSFRTTPESLDTFALLQRMVREGCRHAVMEVSSHALEMRRVQHLAVRTAAFLNLTQDHLDFHGSMEAYYQAKLKLFDGSTQNIPENAIINGEDPRGRELLARLPGDVRVFTFGFDQDCDFYATDLEMSPGGSLFQLNSPQGCFPVFTRLLGRFNVSNLLAALAILHAEGVSLDSVLPALGSFAGVPGRMERVEASPGLTVLVDYAHTDDALRNAVRMLKEITPGRLLVVFGCGGNRDRSKRPLMTQAVLEGADYAWATADNPRSEPLSRIFSDMSQNLPVGAPLRFVDDRRQAIDLALSDARKGDCVLIAGKGHEAFQEFADTVVPFDDRLVARELLQNKPSTQI